MELKTNENLDQKPNRLQGAHFKRNGNIQMPVRKPDTLLRYRKILQHENLNAHPQGEVMSRVAVRRRATSSIKKFGRYDKKSWQSGIRTSNIYGRALEIPEDQPQAKLVHSFRASLDKVGGILESCVYRKFSEQQCMCDLRRYLLETVMEGRQTVYGLWSENLDSALKKSVSEY